MRSNAALFFIHLSIRLYGLTRHASELWGYTEHLAAQRAAAIFIIIGELQTTNAELSNLTPVFFSEGPKGESSRRKDPKRAIPQTGPKWVGTCSGRGI